MVDSFRRSSTPDYSKMERPRPKSRYRGSSRSRGYDANWDKLSKQYRAHVNGLCEECARRGYAKVCDVVDHMIPVADDGEKRLSWNNLDALCHSHHNGFKRRIEEYARKTNAISLLPQWVKHPETRPIHFQIVRDRDGPEVDGPLVINRGALPANEVMTIPKVIVPGVEPVEIFEGRGNLMSMTNSTPVDILIYDGGDVVYFLSDGQSLEAPIMITDGLKVASEEPCSGKVSMAYVQS